MKSKMLTLALIVFALMSLPQSGQSIVYEDEVLTWPQVNIQITNVEPIANRQEPETTVYAIALEDAPELGIEEGMEIEFRVPGGDLFDDNGQFKARLVIPGIPELI